MLHKDCTARVQLKIKPLVMGLKELDARTN
jgi:hypothetical protein